MIRPLYKAQEPFMDVKRGFGYQGVVMYDDQDDKLQCHICGKLFSSLGVHVFRTHKMLSDDYKMEFGLTLRTPLCSVSISRGRSKTARRQRLYENGTMLKAAARVRTRRKPKQFGTATMAFYNRSGLCPLQLQTRFDIVRKIVGHDPKLEDLRKYDAPVIGGIRRMFGNLNNYKRKIGMKASRNGLIAKEDGVYVAALRKWARDNGETPKAASFVGRSSIYRRFGSWSNALRTAGLK